jgi:D-alanyl-D-alanine carboxypeptidase
MFARASILSGAVSLACVLLAGCGGGNQPSFYLSDQPLTSNGPATNLQVDQAVQDAIKQYNLPGASVLVLQDNQIIYAKGYGYANLADRTAVKPETRFQIGSISKQFVATAALLLVEDGKLKLDDPLNLYLSGLPATWQTITVRQLIIHTSGLPENPTPALEAQISRIMADGASDADRIAAIATVPLLHTPGSTFEYSNLGYNILGMLISKVAGMDYFALLQQRVFRPLGMDSVRKLDAAPAATPAAAGYTLQGNALSEFTMGRDYLRFNALGCGGLEMNVLDMAKWDAALYGDKVLKPASIAEMTRRQVSIGSASWYGLGWFLFEVNGHFLMKHAGGMPAFTTDYRRFRDDRFSVIAFTNVGDKVNDIPGALAITRAITEHYHPELKVK